MAASLQNFATEQSGKQRYHVKVPGTASAEFLSVISFEAVEKLGVPYCITIALTHANALNRSDYLGKPASFHITPPAPDWLAAVQAATEPRAFSGCITRFNQVSRTADFHQYEIVIEPRVARLKLATASRIYQSQSALQIIEAILRRHGFDGNQFQFKTRRNYPAHAFRMQYQQSDWDYIHLLMRQEGLYCYFAAGQHGDVFGDVIVFGDDIDHYIYKPELKVPYRETAGLEANTEAILSLQTHTQTVAQSVKVADYNPAKALDRLQNEANIARADTTTYGQAYVYGTHHLDQDEAQWEARLRHEAVLAGQVVYHGSSNVLELRPARILRMDQDLPDAPNGQVIVSVTHRGTRDMAYSNTYTAIPSDRRYRIALDEANWPKVSGTLSARVTSPANYQYAYIDSQGHYIVRFDFDFDDWRAGGESVRLRLAKPFAGGRQTGFHFPILAGTEAAIAFTDGNPNKPYIAYLHHNSRQGDLIVSDDRWLSRNVIRTQRDNKLQMEDFEGEEHVKLSTEHSGKSQLTLGHMPIGRKVDGRRQKRGAGFELRTDAHGVVRGGHGLLLTSDLQLRAGGKQVDMSAAQTLLEQLQAQAQGLAQVADVARAEVAELHMHRQWLSNSVAELKEAALLLSSPKGIAAATPVHINLSAGQDIAQRSGADHSISAAKRIMLAASQGLSLFTHKMGIKLFAAQGKVQIQAQNDTLEITGQQDVQLTSAKGKTTVNASNGVLLHGGGSAYIKIHGDNIEIGGAGKLDLKIASVSKDGPGALNLPLPAFQQKDIAQSERYVLMNTVTNRPNIHRDYRIRLADGSIVSGTTDAEGRTSLTQSDVARGITLLTDLIKEG
ncbi:type VI secretion system tip protein VgrG [Herbaspirillum sp. LeCh32-8]|uniref:type VI secretion system Vgr family protein n=1 Tax=Herbaspirillum sp. LeCh32-8 TaxID=2821356 RepID=UPI001AE639A2|nr:type VI secretion system tip protein VgrG [Herbaspirillum sp. LeCh32-8]MBP0597026.1 type VI secretion system tip protein VgrG [Herbaspirillum sp. LeCh32-8]